MINPLTPRVYYINYFYNESPRVMCLLAANPKWFFFSLGYGDFLISAPPRDIGLELDSRAPDNLGITTSCADFVPLIIIPGMRKW